MANKEQPTNDNQKIQTRYDRKLEERKRKEALEKRNTRIAKFTAVAIALGAVAVVGYSYLSASAIKKSVINDPYVAVGEHQLTKLEYDYYYNNTVNNYITSYGSILPYIGLDPTKDFATQQYTDTMTWKDMFDQMTVEQIKQSKALTDEANASGFTYDTTAEYQTALDNISQSAKTAGVSTSTYYQRAYGTYATEQNVAPMLKEGILVSAYYDELLNQNKPSDQEVKDYYNANVQDYDKVDYHSFNVKAQIPEGATEEDTTKAMEAAKKQAEDMMAARQSGSEFKALALELASEEEKAIYQDETSDATLKSGQYKASMSADIAAWLYEDGRKQGDMTVIEDTISEQYYVVEFVNRYFDEADNQRISDTLAGEKVQQHLTTLVEGYQVTDLKGDLTYLIIPETLPLEGESVAPQESQEETSQAAESDSADATQAAASEEATTTQAAASTDTTTTAQP